MKTPLFLLKATLLATLLFALPASAQAVPERPNIVLILVDDMGFSDIGSYGGEIQTPHLDTLASQGIRFTGMRNTAKCFSSRASLLTGVYHHQSGSTSADAPLNNVVTLGEVLRDAGYRTLASGKHHSIVNLYDRGFDRYYGLRDGAANHFNPGLQRSGEPEPARKGIDREWADDALVFDTRDAAYQSYFPAGFYSTDAFTDKALEYLDAYGNDPEPFFLYLSYTAPHDPLMAHDADIAKYAGTYDVGYDAIRQARYSKLISEGLFSASEAPLSPATHTSWNSLNSSDKADQARRMQVYAAMIDRVDQRIGDVLDKLDELGVTDNTLILFASDNGASAENYDYGDQNATIGGLDRYASQQADWANVSNTPFRFYKNDSYDGGILTPFIAYWPDGIANPGRIDHRPSHFIDIMATVLELSGAEYPRRYNNEGIVPLEGESFGEVLRDETVPARGPVFFEWNGGQAVIDGDWKLVKRSGTWALYDLANDRTELTDVKGTETTVYNDLLSKYNSWFQRADQVIPETTDDVLAATVGSQTTLQPLANDGDSDGSIVASSLEILAGPYRGSVVVQPDGTIDYTHDNSLTRKDLLLYRVKDNDGAWSNTGQVVMNVGSGSGAAQYEAEDATLSGVDVKSIQPGFTGSGYADYVNATTDYIEWTISAASSGTYSLDFRYALGATGDRPLEVRVDGSVENASLSFPFTGAWDTWGYTATVDVTLSAGFHTVRATAIGSSGPNVDHLRLTPPAGDADSDQIPGWWEALAGMSDGNSADAALDLDGDGQSALQEFLFGTDPNDGNSIIRGNLEWTDSGFFKIIWPAAPGIEYQVETSPDLSPGNWTTIDSLTPNAASAQYNDYLPFDSNRKFYRIGVAE